MSWLIQLALLATPALSEYRAYELQITNLQTGAERTVLSNFDPDQYRDIYPVLKEEEIRLLNSWKCKGDTSHKPICPNPKSGSAPGPL